MNEKIIEAVKQVASYLVNEDYKGLEILTKGVRANEDDIKGMILSYGRKLVKPPENVYDDDLDIIEIKDSERPTFSACMHLWTEEEGMSDLSLELTLITVDEDVLIELDNIHVL